MKFRKNMFYKIKRLIPMMGLAGLTTLPIACEDPEQEALLEEAKRTLPVDVDSIAASIDSTMTSSGIISVPFPQEMTQMFRTESEEEIIKNFVSQVSQHLNDSILDTIYVVPSGNWENTTKSDMQHLRCFYLQPALEMSSKIRGRGDFNFKLGEASQIFMDSVWFAQNGWTINKKHHTNTPRDIEIKFDAPETLNSLYLENILGFLANDSTVRSIYLIPEGSRWSSFSQYTIPGLRQCSLEPCIKASPKVHGRGDFNFRLGEASKVPEDSIWITQQGWTINKAYQNNQNQK